MVDESKPRRKISVDGVEVTEPPSDGPRAVAEVLGLDRDPSQFEGQPIDADGQPVAVYSPDRLQAFLAGQITLGDLEGISKEEQYQIAALGFSCLSSGKLEEAEQIFLGLLALDPFDAYFNLAVGSVAQQQGDLESAEQRYSRALEINPYSATAHAHRGEIRIQTGRLADGVDDLLEALGVDREGREPATHRARATLRVLAEKLGSLDRTELERNAQREREELAETEEVVEEALAEAREAERRLAEGTPEPEPEGLTPGEAVTRRTRASAKKPR